MADKVPFLHAGKIIMVDYVDETPDYKVGVTVAECDEETRLKNRKNIIDTAIWICTRGMER